MKLTSSSFPDGGVIPDRFALARPAPDTHATFSDNVSPQFSWDEVPEGTRSFALICIDPLCPSLPDDVNQEGREVPEELPRVDFVHWVLVDMPASLRELEEGEYGEGVVPHGRQAARGPHGTRQGLNDYTGWFAGNPDMEGKFYGYDGPAPPWNDSRIHQYVFTLYALDIYRVPVDGDFRATDVIEAIRGHVLAEASWMGTYTQNPRLRD